VFADSNCWPLRDERFSSSLAFCGGGEETTAAVGPIDAVTLLNCRPAGMEKGDNKD
jgi:hypothetical protein